MEFYNEFTIWLVFVFMIPFGMGINDSGIGWVIIGLVLGNICGNAGLILGLALLNIGQMIMKQVRKIMLKR